MIPALKCLSWKSITQTVSNFCDNDHSFNNGLDIPNLAYIREAAQQDHNMFINPKSPGGDEGEEEEVQRDPLLRQMTVCKQTPVYHSDPK